MNLYRISITALALMVFSASAPAVAGKLLGVVHTEVRAPENVDEYATIEVYVHEKNEAPNAKFHAHNFAKALQKRYPNTLFLEAGEASRAPDIEIAFFAKSKLYNESGEETVYSQEPSSWRCSSFLSNIECNVSGTSRRAVGTRHVEYTFAGFTIQTGWYFTQPDGSYKLRLIANSNLAMDVEQDMCSNAEAYTLMSEAMSEHIRADVPVERKFEYSSPRKAKCSGD